MIGASSVCSRAVYRTKGISLAESRCRRSPLALSSTAAERLGRSTKSKSEFLAITCEGASDPLALKDQDQAAMKGIAFRETTEHPISVGERHDCRCALSSARHLKRGNVALARAMSLPPIALGAPLPSQGFFVIAQRKTTAGARGSIAAPRTACPLCRRFLLPDRHGQHWRLTCRMGF